MPLQMDRIGWRGDILLGDEFNALITGVLEEQLVLVSCLHHVRVEFVVLHGCRGDAAWQEELELLVEVSNGLAVILGAHLSERSYHVVALLVHVRDLFRR